MAFSLAVPVAFASVATWLTWWPTVADADAAVQKGIINAGTFLVFGSAKYGERTDNAACTYYESKFAQSQQKKIVLIRMIPFGQEFEFPQGKFMFG